MPKRDREGHYFATLLSKSYKSLTHGSPCPLAPPSRQVHAITCVKQLGLWPCQTYGRTVSQATYGREQVTIYWLGGRKTQLAPWRTSPPPAANKGYKEAAGVRALSVVPICWGVRWGLMEVDERTWTHSHLVSVGWGNCCLWGIDSRFMRGSLLTCSKMNNREIWPLLPA